MKEHIDALSFMYTALMDFFTDTNIEIFEIKRGGGMYCSVETNINTVEKYICYYAHALAFE